MFDIKKYIKDGAVNRDKIAMDIKYREIGLEEINAIVNDPEIKAAFFGDGFPNKLPKSQWTEKHLDLVFSAVVAEYFNAEFLYYLNDVAEYVNGRKNGNSKLIIGAIVLVVAVAALVLVVSGLNR